LVNFGGLAPPHSRVHEIKSSFASYRISRTRTFKKKHQSTKQFKEKLNNLGVKSYNRLNLIPNTSK